MRLMRREKCATAEATPDLNHDSCFNGGDTHAYERSSTPRPLCREQETRSRSASPSALEVAPCSHSPSTVSLNSTSPDDCEGGEHTWHYTGDVNVCCSKCQKVKDQNPMQCEISTPREDASQVVSSADNEEGDEAYNPLGSAEDNQTKDRQDATEGLEDIVEILDKKQPDAQAHLTRDDAPLHASKTTPEGPAKASWPGVRRRSRSASAKD